MSNWHYATGGEKHGPITATQLKELATTGRISPDDLVWREDMKEWRKAATVKGLFPETAAATLKPPTAELEVPPTPTSTDAPALWNPQAVGLWSILFFTPIIGSFLIATNWKSLGDEEKYRHAMYWFYGFLGFVFLGAVTPDGRLITGAFTMLGLGLSVAWASRSALPQIKYVKEEFGSKYPRKGWLTPIGVGCAFVGVFLIAAVTGGMESEDVQIVKGASLDDHPGIAVGAVVDSYLDDPHWSSGKTSTGQRFVNVTGGITYQGKPVQAKIQFLLTDKSFTVHSFELNELPQNNLIKLAFIEKMYSDFRTSDGK